MRWNIASLRDEMAIVDTKMYLMVFILISVILVLIRDIKINIYENNPNIPAMTANSAN